MIERSEEFQFAARHIGPSRAEAIQMLGALGFRSTEDLMSAVLPAQIRSSKALNLEAAVSEREALAELKSIASRNLPFRSLIGMGYYGTFTPPVIQRCVLENPGWYTQYTPYQAEIAQGRLEALLSFQTLISDLTGLEVSNASLLDEATAAAEAMAMCFSIAEKSKDKSFLVSDQCFPQTIAVVKARGDALGAKVIVGKVNQAALEKELFGCLVQFPEMDGKVWDYSDVAKRLKEKEALLVVAADLLSLTLYRPPGELGADIAVGTAQRLGVPVGFGGPHAGYLATREEHKRRIPGRIVGASKDASGNVAYRLALQTREQHIRRDKATSNICTAQVLLAIISSMYAIYHGPGGLRGIASRIHRSTLALGKALTAMGCKLTQENYFDTLSIEVSAADLDRIKARAEAEHINFCYERPGVISLSLDELTSPGELTLITEVFALPGKAKRSPEVGPGLEIPDSLVRKSAFLSHPTFNRYHSETEMMRYIRRLESRDLSLTSSMIPLGSCTMKLNAAAELLPVTWPEFGQPHPFAPVEQTQGYTELFRQLERMLCAVTGFDAVSLQPNAGSQGEYAGLLVIQKYHRERGDHSRQICLIPRSAHGTNPASAAMAGMEIVVVDCDANGNVDLADLKRKAELHAAQLAALMITYPSTHGVFEQDIRQICETIHQVGGQVYMDGANMNAQVGLCFPGEYGPDVCHLNLHKTFCIPHGGGGPGMGPIAVKAHLAPYLPNHPVVTTGGASGIGPVAAAPWGSPSILPISWMYIRMMGPDGLRRASEVAILNANYIAKRLDSHYPVLYKGQGGLVAHECIIDLRGIKDSTGIEVEDVAKRLMDYGFHAPTISFPVAGTLMIEPTESESLEELDRFCEAMIEIRKEIAEIEEGKSDRKDNVLKNAPHTAQSVISSTWNRPYTRERAAFPAKWLRGGKFWPAVARIDNVAGDRHLICTCPSPSEYEKTS